MKLAQEVWRSVKQTTIVNYWKHTKILSEIEANSSTRTQAETNNDMVSLQSAMDTLQQQLVSLQCPMSNLITAEQFVGAEDDTNLHLARLEIDEILQEHFNFGGDNHGNPTNCENDTSGDSIVVDIQQIIQKNRRQACITNFFRSRA
jgi:hypothetical protein